MSLYHKGTVIALTDSFISVRVEVDSACGTCKSRSVCGAAEGVDKVINVANTQPESYEIGDSVIVSIKSSMGMKALLWVYIIPIFLIIGTLILTLNSGLSESISGIITLGSVGIYYLFLYVFRNKIEKNIDFQIRHS